MDPLSGVLSLLRVRNYHSATLRLGGEWAFNFPASEGIKFTAVASGSCWLAVNGQRPAVKLQQGDCFLMTRGMPFSLFSDISLAPIDGSGYFQRLSEDEITLNHGGDDVQLVGGRFEFSGMPTQILLSTLPALVHVQQASKQASILRWALERFTAELHECKPGRSLMTEHLAHIMLVEVMRTHMATTAAAEGGWFSGLADRNLNSAMSAIHAQPAERWSVETLARLANMSRSAFAQRFKDVVGLAPMEYLTRWRMLLASDRLKNTTDSVSSIAFSLGYESESAFSTAFKRVMSQSPRQYQRS
ncbi:TPA: AraC family transcriptional regulator [Pseudomonas putida]|nr:AraC family transcriptional regulator [Pseudomonas putida]